MFDDDDETGETAAHYDRLLGGTVQTLIDRGHVEPAALLLDCRLAHMTYIDTVFPIGSTLGDGDDLYEASIQAPAYVSDRLTLDMREAVHAALSHALRAENSYVTEVRYAAPLPPADWREAPGAASTPGPAIKAPSARTRPSSSSTACTFAARPR
ncbi:hypothetical protein [Terrabacter sp. MAHUQ-38]|uniref:hypothetical protein n=1 Tax=unclassified Terrabacter TaxID=2630222 RepID=UPI00165DB80D|nr:hypothetical protein [Terrabacter sp. MAHUQ-38]MBC9822829.1 hypothetical protein [Terrabacter sp. MAHUQ-38]